MKVTSSSRTFNPLMPGGNKKFTHTYTNLQPKVCVTFVLTRH